MDKEPKLLRSDYQRLGLNKVEPINTSMDDIAGIAKVLIKESGYDCFKEESLTDLVENRLKGRIFEHLDFDAEPIGEMAAKDGLFEIGISRFEMFARKRFTIAHEIGHYILHSILQESRPIIAFRTEGSNRAEAEANCFAAELLMPRKQFKEIFQETKGDFIKISSKFHVSSEAVYWRAVNLNLGL